MKAATTKRGITLLLVVVVASPLAAQPPVVNIRFIPPAVQHPPCRQVLRARRNWTLGVAGYPRARKPKGL